MSEKILVPKRRFKGFYGDWEENKLFDVIDICSGRDYKHLRIGDIPVYGTGGYMLSVNQALSYEDAIGIGRKGTIDKPLLLKAPFWTVDTLFYTLPKDQNDLNFLYSLFQRINWKKNDESTGVPSLSKNTINLIELFTTKKKEQTKIGDFFKQLDILIRLQQKKLDKLKATKQAYLCEMFPSRGENVPKRRFKGFSEAWKVCRIEEVCNYVDYRVKTPTKTNEGIFLVTAKNIKMGHIDYSNSQEYVLSSEYSAIMSRGLPAIGDVLITTEAPCGNVAQVDRTDIALAQRVIKYRGVENVIDNYFLMTRFITLNFQNALLSKATGGTVSGIKGSVLHKLMIQIPSFEEQTRIGDFFKQLDKQISLQQRKFVKLQDVKKSLSWRTVCVKNGGENKWGMHLKVRLKERIKKLLQENLKNTSGFRLIF